MLHNTAQYNTTQHNISQHTTQHNTTQQHNTYIKEVGMNFHELFGVGKESEDFLLRKEGPVSYGLNKYCCRHIQISHVAPLCVNQLE